MQVAYDHPPRKLNFYLRILFWLVIICLPIFIILPIWYPYVPVLWLSGLILVTVAFRIGAVIKQAMQLNLSIEDYHLPKSMDVSKLEMDVPDSLEDTKILLELEGFERLGEMEGYTSGSNKPIPGWVFSKANGKLIAAATSINGNAFMAFTTYGENGMVMTYYPKAHSLTLANSRFSGVSSSIEDAYKYHLKQVKAMRPKIGQVVPVKSVKHYLFLDAKFSDQSIKHQWMHVQDFITLHTATSVLFAFGYALFASWIFPYTFLGLFWEWRLLAAAMLFIVAIVVGLIAENRKNGITNIEKG